MKTVLTILAAIAVTAPAAFAHVNFETKQAQQGSTYIGTLGIGHGCEGEPTLKVRVQIPEGVIAVKPVPKAGWSVEIITGAYANTYDYFGTPTSEGVKELIWTGELSDAHFDQFSFRGKLTDTLEAGSTIYFPTIQECASGSHDWVYIPAAGQDAHDIDDPAPGLKITKPEHHHNH
ncbi:MAG: YcnI family protein [Litoreibacter sp.]|uniref:YcnI family copper-binding membrane protein n=1 Tax=Litoreibacter sp. TaxID=1969459 RepID=UPI00329724AA